jgi:hypothetical protein
MSREKKEEEKKSNRMKVYGGHVGLEKYCQTYLEKDASLVS